MKTVLRLAVCVLLTVVLASCQSKEENKVGSSISFDIQKIDTVIFHGQAIHLKAIDSLEFSRYPLDVNVGDMKMDEIIDDTIHVQRFDSTLALQFDNGDSVWLVSKPNSLDDNRVNYVYVEYLKGLGSFFVENTYYETADYSLWKKSTGKETRMISYPLLSPDKKLVLCYHADVYTNESPNCFQLFSVSPDTTLELKWQNESKWGPEQCIWKDNKTIYIKAAYRDSVAYRTTYLSLELPDFK